MDVFSRTLVWLIVMGATTALPTQCVASDVLIEQQKVGERVHDFELPIVGERGYLTLSDAYREGPVVVIVLRGYPGYQCPICTRQVASLANRSSALKSVAAKVVLVYPGDVDDLNRRAEQFKGTRRLPEPMILVRDNQMKTVRKWGLHWDKHHETAYPATYVVDRNGDIRWKKVSTSHAERSSVEEILKELRKL